MRKVKEGNREVTVDLVDPQVGPERGEDPGKWGVGRRSSICYEFPLLSLMSYPRLGRLDQCLARYNEGIAEPLNVSFFFFTYSLLMCGPNEGTMMGEPLNGRPVHRPRWTGRY